MIHAECIVTFAENLTIKADLYENKLDISNEIADIKKCMEDCYEDREFTIYLYNPHTNFTVGYVHSHKNYASLFIPKCVSPQHYRAMFIEELEKLGFNEYDLNDTHDRCCDCYSIKVRW